jgi:hypothetical protein
VTDPTQPLPPEQPGPFGQPQQPYGTPYQQFPQQPYGAPVPPLQQSYGAPPYAQQPEAPQYPAQPMAYPMAPPPVDPARAKRRKQNKIILGVLAGVLLIGCVGCIGAAVAGDNKDDKKTSGKSAAVVPTQTTSKATSTTPKATPTTAKATPTTAKSTPAASGKTDAERVTGWYADGGSDELNTLSDDMNDMAAATDPISIDGMRTACRHLQQDVKASKNHPIPVPSIQAPYGKALTQFGKAASDCLSGIDSLDVDTLGRASDELAKGTTYMEQATAALAKLMK